MALAIAAGFLPAIGPVIAGGILAAIAASAASGAAASTVVGALVGLGVTDEEAAYYDAEFKKGRTIVVLKGNDRRALAETILTAHHARSGILSPRTIADQLRGHPRLSRPPSRADSDPRTRGPRRPAPPSRHHLNRGMRALAATIRADARRPQVLRAWARRAAGPTDAGTRRARERGVRGASLSDLPRTRPTQEESEEPHGETRTTSAVRGRERAHREACRRHRGERDAAQRQDHGARGGRRDEKDHPRAHGREAPASMPPESSDSACGSRTRTARGAESTPSAASRPCERNRLRGVRVTGARRRRGDAARRDGHRAGGPSHPGSCRRRPRASTARKATPSKPTTRKPTKERPRGVPRRARSTHPSQARARPIAVPAPVTPRRGT